MPGPLTTAAAERRDRAGFFAAVFFRLCFLAPVFLAAVFFFAAFFVTLFLTAVFFFLPDFFLLLDLALVERFLLAAVLRVAIAL